MQAYKIRATEGGTHGSSGSRMDPVSTLNLKQLPGSTPSAGLGSQEIEENAYSSLVRMIGHDRSAESEKRKTTK